MRIVVCLVSVLFSGVCSIACASERHLRDVRPDSIPTAVEEVAKAGGGTVIVPKGEWVTKRS